MAETYVCGFETFDHDTGRWKACKAKMSEKQIRKGILRDWRCKKCGKQKLANFTPVNLTERVMNQSEQQVHRRRPYY